MIDLEPFHYVAVAVSVLLFYQSVRLVRTRKENLFEFLVWVSFGVGILLYSIASAVESIELLGYFNGTLRSLGFGNEWRGLFAISIVALYLVVFYTYTIVKTTDRRMADLQQEIALLRYELERDREDVTAGPRPGLEGSRRDPEGSRRDLESARPDVDEDRTGATDGGTRTGDDRT